MTVTFLFEIQLFSHCIPIDQHLMETDKRLLCSVIIRVYIIGGDGTQRGANAIHEVSTKFPLCGARFAFTSNSPASASIMFVQGVLCIPAS
jgi:hypothetical protein